MIGTIIIGLLCAAVGAVVALKLGPGMREVVTQAPALVPGDGRITRSGCYVLDRDLKTDRKIAIHITADLVDLDLNGHSVTAETDVPVAGTMGIFLDGVRNATIRNGRLRGWWYGVHAKSCRGVNLMELHLTDVGYIGLSVHSSYNSVIEHNRIKDFRPDIGKPTEDFYCIGINMRSHGGKIADNVIEHRFGQFDPVEEKIEMVGILVPATDTHDCMIARNIIVYDRLSLRTHGIWQGAETETVMLGNRVRNARYGLCIGENGAVVVTDNVLNLDIISIDETLPDKIRGIDTSGISVQANRAVVVHNKISNFDPPVSQISGALVQDNRIDELSAQSVPVDED